MCGRYTHKLSWQQIAVALSADAARPAAGCVPRELQRRPTDVMPIVRPAGNGRELIMARWGLVPGAGRLQGPRSARRHGLRRVAGERDRHGRIPDGERVRHRGGQGQGHAGVDGCGLTPALGSQDRQECPSAPAVLSTLSTAALPTGLENPFKTLENRTIRQAAGNCYAVCYAVPTGSEVLTDRSRVPVAAAAAAAPRPAGAARPVTTFRTRASCSLPFTVTTCVALFAVRLVVRYLR